MKLILILAGNYTSCESTRNIWYEVCQSRNVELETYNIDDKEATDISQQMNLNTFPALIYNNQVIAVGHPNKSQAAKIIDGTLINKNTDTNE